MKDAHRQKKLLPLQNKIKLNMRKTCLLVMMLCLTLTAAVAQKEKNVKRPDTYNYNRGLEELNNNNTEEALNYFKKEVENDPKNGYAYTWMSLIYYYDNQYGNALSAINMAQKYLPKKDVEYVAYALCSRADIYLALEDTIKALEDFSTAIKTYPKDEDIYKKRAQVYFELQQYDKADSDYEQIKKQDQASSLSYMGIGRNRNAQERWDEAIEQFNQVITLYSTYSQAYAFRAKAYMGKEDWAKATDDILTALTIDSSDDAFALLQELKDDAADMMITKFKIQATKKPNEFYWPYCIGLMYENANLYGKAISYYEKANSIDVNPITYYRISICHLNANEYEDALNNIDKTLELDSTDITYRLTKGMIMNSMDNADAAIAEWDKFIADYPDYSWGYSFRADMKTVKHDYAGSIDDLTMAITLNTNASSFYCKRADLCHLTGDETKAKADYQKVIDMETEGGSYDRAPYAFLGIGNKAKAIAVMDSILSAENADEDDYYDAACLYSRMKDKQKALDYLGKAFEKGYNNAFHIQRDYDMDFLRDTKEFADTIAKYFSTANVTFEEVDDIGEWEEADKAEQKREMISEIPFTKEGGVCNVKCKINDLPLYFVFDTGASTVSLSMVEATFMMKNGYLSDKDVIGSQRFSDANGNVSEGTIINLRKVQFGDLELDNIRASVVRNQKAPLLLGQTVLSRAGKIEIDNEKRVVRVKYIK